MAGSSNRQISRWRIKRIDKSTHNAIKANAANYGITIKKYATNCVTEELKNYPDTMKKLCSPYKHTDLMEIDIHSFPDETKEQIQVLCYNLNIPVKAFVMFSLFRK